MIDLHLHTTASDGMCSPRELVRRARAAGVTILSVTDHDTTAAVAETARIAATDGLELVTGIEITAVWEGHDVHILGYFLDPSSPSLAEFLARQRANRLARVRAIGERLAEIDAPVDLDPIVAGAARHPDRAVGRPHLARALVHAGHVTTTREAFERFIGEGCPAYVPRRGTSPTDVIRIIGDAGGIASLAHPGRLGRDELIPDLARAGLAALEAYHSDHTPETVQRYLDTARRLDLAVSGGSDYHGEPTHRTARLGTLSLPAEEFAHLKAKVRGMGAGR